MRTAVPTRTRAAHRPPPPQGSTSTMRRVGGAGGGKSSPSRVYGAVCLIAFASYLNGLSGDFVHDDIPAITRNKDVLALTPLQDVLRNDFWGTPMADVSSHKSYRPLTVLSFRANYLIWGLQSICFHVVNVSLHAIACLLFTRVCLVIAGLQPNFAGMAGLMFAVHPIHTEAVTGIVGRADVLACVFFLMSFLVYHGRSSFPSSSDNLFVFLSVILGGFSMLAKESGVTVLAVNILYDVYKSWHSIKRSISETRWNEETSHLTRRTVKVFVSLFLLILFRFALLQGSLPKFSNQDNPAAFHPCRHVRFLTFCYLAAFNCWLLLCPMTLSHDWQMGSVPLVTSYTDTRNIATCLFFGCCLIVAYKGLVDFEQQRHAPLILGGLLLILPFLPAANIAVTVGFVVAERILYIPSMGFVLLVVYGAQIVWGIFFRHRSLFLYAALLLLIIFFSRTIIRNRDWYSRESLIRAGIKALPHNAKMHYNFANFQRDSSNFGLAASHYKESLRLWPTYASAHNNLGTLMSDIEEAESLFLAAIRYSPNHVNAHYNLGQVYRKLNRSEEAVRMLERCIFLDSSYIPAYLLLSRLYATMGKEATVGRLLKHVITLHPHDSDYLAEYASWLYKRCRHWEALRYYERALSLTLAHKISMLGAAQVLRAKGQWPRIHQLMIRYHMMSRDHGGGIVYSGDLYMERWKGDSVAKQDTRTDAMNIIHKSQQESYLRHICARYSERDSSTQSTVDKDKTPRKKSKYWRRIQINKTIVVHPGNQIESSCSVSGTEFSNRVDENGHSSGTASFNQGYHYSFWTEQQLKLAADSAVALNVDTPTPLQLSGDRDMFCLGIFPDPTNEEDFSPEFMTG